MEYQKVRARTLTTWKTKLYCFSSLKYGSSLLPPIGSFLLVQIPCVTFSVDLFSKEEYVKMGFLIVLQIIVNIAMLTVLCTNPGILPQIIPQYESDESFFNIPSREAREEHRYLITTHSLLHNQKFCSECQMYRPIRSIHCGSCNHCVERYDHHCPWLAICIGKFNYKYFIFYLSSLMVLIIYTFGIGLSFTIENIIYHDWPEDYIIIILITVLSGIFILPLLRLLIYHFQLMSKGITTNEDLKKTYKIIGNSLPFKKIESSFLHENRYQIIPEFYYCREQARRQIEMNSWTERSESSRKSNRNPLIKNQQL